MKCKYSKKIYREDAILFSIISFRNICEIEVDDSNEDYWILKFGKFDGNENVLKREFDNYLIDSMNRTSK